MKKQILYLVVLFIGFMTSTQAQRVAVVDVNDLLTSLPEYRDAQAQLDEIAAKWKQEIAVEMDKVKSMYNKYQAEQILLSDEKRKQREDEIVEKESSVMELQRLRFGPEGDLFKKRQELVKPLQDLVFSAIETFAQDRGFDIILDKSSGGGLIFLNDEFDKTEDVRKRIGK